MSQSPYKGFNRVIIMKFNFRNVSCLNPPIRGSIDYFAKTLEILSLLITSLNPPIRGSIEQDNALFENYNHKR